jgi:hypothetical protein
VALAGQTGAAIGLSLIFCFFWIKTKEKEKTFISIKFQLVPKKKTDSRQPTTENLQNKRNPWTPSPNNQRVYYEDKGLLEILKRTL